MPKRLIIFAFAALIFCSCKKDKSNTTSPPVATSNIIKISIVSGDEQSSQVGSALNDSILVKVTKGGTPAANIAVQFTGSGCNSDLTATVYTKADGIAKYLWRLAANTGKQNLNIVAVNNTIKADSVQATATAQPASTYADAVSACTPYNIPASTFCQLTTGRIFACFDGKTSLRYSDDDGLSWQPLASLGIMHHITILRSTPKNEIFVATANEGIFYSKDAGSNWTNISPPDFGNNYPIDMAYTNSGKLLLTTVADGNAANNKVFVTADNGHTWVVSVSGLTSNYDLYCPVELTNGDLYVINGGRSLFKSTDKGASWSTQPENNPSSLISICTDKNGWFYKCYTNNATIFISKNNGQSFISYAAADGMNMDILPNGYLYFNNYVSLYRIIPNPNGSNSTLTQLVCQNIDPAVFSFDNYALTSQKHILYVYKGLIMRQPTVQN